MKAEDYLRNGNAYIWEETFAIIKSKRTCLNAFANIVDKNEITVIIDQSKFNEKDAIEIERDWKILTFDMVLPLGLVGFMAKVSQALANEKISVFSISAFSTDHILVKEEDLARAIGKLEDLGCVIKEK